MRKVKFLDLKAVNQRFEHDFLAVYKRVAQSGWYLLGEELQQFESEYAQYCGTRYAIGVANGLDALLLIWNGLIELGRLRPGDEVIVPAHTYIASMLSISGTGLTPVPVEVNPSTFNLGVKEVESAITKRTKAIFPVHLYGRLAEMEGLINLCEKHDVLLVEDAAQAHGAQLGDTRAGCFGFAAGFSFYPGKNLGCLGDGGAVTVSDEDLAQVIRELRNYGSREKYVHPRKGINSRLDELQAGLLRVKLNHLDSDNRLRQQVARTYLEEIQNPDILLPTDPGDQHIWHLFVVRVKKRDHFRAYLKERGIETLIHYPIPVHKQWAYKEWSAYRLPLAEQLAEEVVSLPISPVLEPDEVAQVIRACNQYRA